MFGGTRYEIRDTRYEYASATSTPKSPPHTHMTGRRENIMERSRRSISLINRHSTLDAESIYLAPIPRDGGPFRRESPAGGANTRNALIFSPDFQSGSCPPRPPFSTSNPHLSCPEQTKCVEGFPHLARRAFSRVYPPPQRIYTPRSFSQLL